jgi:pimeloyl-ACP methyl ester carboxylesterase
MRNATVLHDQQAIGPGMASFRLGSGPTLLYLPGLASHHRLPTGVERRIEVGLVRRYAADRQVWWLQRRQGLPGGTTMADIADDYAAVLREWDAGPVDVLGFSTGGSVALQLAADHPEVVRRLVIVSSAARLEPAGADQQRRIGELLHEGDRRAAAADLLSLVGGSPLARRGLAGLGWLVGPALIGPDSADMQATIQAEDRFDLTGRLPGMSTPTLVVGGERDRFYGADAFRRTAAGLPHGRLLMRPDQGHVGALTSAGSASAVVDWLG